MKIGLSLFTGALIALASAASAQLATDIAITTPYTFETGASASSAAGYMSITNSGATDDRLIGVRTDGAMAMIHKTEVDDNGVARMQHQMSGVPIPAGETVTFAPGGLHIMLTGLGAPVPVGAVMPVTLTFEAAGDVPAALEVIARGTRPGT